MSLAILFNSGSGEYSISCPSYILTTLDGRVLQIVLWTAEMHNGICHKFKISKDVWVGHREWSSLYLQFFFPYQECNFSSSKLLLHHTTTLEIMCKIQWESYVGRHNW